MRTPSQDGHFSRPGNRDRAMEHHRKDRLRQLFLARAVKRGHFILASGKTSSFYIDSKQVLFHPEALKLLGEGFADLAADLEFEAVGGLEVGALPLAAAMVLAAHDKGRDLEGFFVRKQAKDHGSQRRVEGRVESGQKVLIIDDVLTTGTSAEQAVLAAEQAGLGVAGVVCIVDRQQGAKEKFEGRFPFRSLFTSSDLGLVADST